MENAEIDEEMSDSENSTSTEITKASDIREVSESESLENSSSKLSSTDTNSVISFKYDADDEGVTITNASDIWEVSEAGCLKTSNSELSSTDTDSVISFKYDADDEKDLVTDFEGWTQDDLTASTSSIYITPNEYSDETELPVLDPKELKYLDEGLLDNGTKIWLHSKKVIRIKRKHRVRAFPIPTDDTSDSETLSVTHTPPIHVYRPAVKASKERKGKIRRFLGRVVRVFRCCFGS